MAAELLRVEPDSLPLAFGSLQAANLPEALLDWAGEALEASDRV